MRCRIMCAIVAIGLAAVPARAQTTPTPAPARPAVDVTNADIAAAVKIGMAALAPGKVSVSDRNIKLADIGAYNVAVAFVTRPATKVPSGRALSHDKITEIYYMIRGTGIQVTGTLVDATRQNESTTIGPGFSSASPIAGGRATRLGPGEMQIIPPGTGHVWTEIDEGGIDYMVIRIDPEHVLSLSK